MYGRWRTHAYCFTRRGCFNFLKTIATVVFSRLFAVICRTDRTTATIVFRRRELCFIYFSHEHSAPHGYRRGCCAPKRDRTSFFSSFFFSGVFFFFSSLLPGLFFSVAATGGTRVKRTKWIDVASRDKRNDSPHRLRRRRRRRAVV